MSTTSIVGLIGLGAIGSAFANRLLRAGFEVLGYDPSEPARSDHLKKGALLAQGVSEIAQQCDIVITSLPNTNAADAVAAELGSVDREGRNGWLLETSTFTAPAKERIRSRLEAAGWSTLDCTLSGHPEMVRDDTYTLYVSGRTGHQPKVDSVIEALSSRAVDAGEFGQAATIKLIINLMVISHDTVAAEAMSLAERAGMDKSFAYDLISSSAGTSRMFEVRGKMMANSNYPAHASMYGIIVDKDGPLIADLARELRHPIPLFSVALQSHVAGMARGWDGLDPASIAEVYLGRNGPAETA